jgi:hypothetical protein
MHTANNISPGILIIHCADSVSHIAVVVKAICQIIISQANKAPLFEVCFMIAGEYYVM